jgi:hypothetical protein
MWLQGISNISSSFYLDMSDTVFGSQVVRGIQLLSMNKPKDGNGYYYCSHQVAFGQWLQFVLVKGKNVQCNNLKF